jgi:hypothetical protein
VAGRQQPFGQRTADEAGTTGNEVSQLAFPCRLAADRGQKLTASSIAHHLV